MSNFVRPGRIEKLREELAKEKNEKLEIRAALMQMILKDTKIAEVEAENARIRDIAQTNADKNRQIIAAWLHRDGDGGGAEILLTEAQQHEAYRHALRVVIGDVKNDDGTVTAKFSFDPALEPRELPQKPLAAAPPPPDTPDTAEPSETATSPEPAPGPHAVEDPADSTASA